MKVGPIVFCLANQKEQHEMSQRHMGTESHSYVCGGCDKPVHGRVIAKSAYDSEDLTNKKGDIIWCVCPCGQPTIIKMQTSPIILHFQSPVPVEFVPGENWPQELNQLFIEAAAAFSARAFTASAMVCRKILMAIACKEGEADGKQFIEYVDFIVSKVVPISTAKNSIDRIRKIGNEANHNITFVSEPDARRALEIARYVLNAAYSLPAA